MPVSDKTAAKRALVVRRHLEKYLTESQSQFSRLEGSMPNPWDPTLESKRKWEVAAMAFRAINRAFAELVRKTSQSNITDNSGDETGSMSLFLRVSKRLLEKVNMMKQ